MLTGKHDTGLALASLRHPAQAHQMNILIQRRLGPLGRAPAFLYVLGVVPGHILATIEPADLSTPARRSKLAVKDLDTRITME